MNILSIWQAYGDAWLEIMWQITWQSTVFVLIVLLLDKTILRRAQANLRYAVWLLALLKFIVLPGISAPSGWGSWGPQVWNKVCPPAPNLAKAPNLRKVADRRNRTRLSAPIESEVAASVTPSDTGLGVSSAVVAAGRQPEPEMNIPSVLAGIWTTVVAALLAFAFGRYLRLRNSIASATALKNGSMPEIVKECARKLGLRGTPTVRISERNCGPIVYGLWRPTILFPKSLIENFSPDELRSVICHELAHIRRFDLVVNWLQVFVQIVFFFNPIVWYVNRRLRAERERACDDWVLTIVEERKMYAETLVKTAELTDTDCALAAGVVEPRGAIADRIRTIMDSERLVRTSLSWKGITLLTLIALVCLPAMSGAQVEKAGGAKEPAQEKAFQEKEQKSESAAQNWTVILRNGKRIKGKVRDMGDTILITTGTGHILSCKKPDVERILLGQDDFIVMKGGKIIYGKGRGKRDTIFRTKEGRMSGPQVEKAEDPAKAAGENAVEKKRQGSQNITNAQERKEGDLKKQLVTSDSRTEEGREVKGRLHKLFQRTVTRFQQGEYDEAIRAAEEILKIRPDNGPAKTMIEAAEKERQKELQKPKGERRRILRETLKPQETKYPDLSTWRKITKYAVKVSPDARMSLQKKVTFDFKNTPLIEVIGRLCEKVGLKWWLSPQIIDVLKNTVVTASAEKEMPLRDALERVLPQGLTYETAQDSIRLREAQLIFRVYDVRDLFPVTVPVGGEVPRAERYSKESVALLIRTIIRETGPQNWSASDVSGAVGEIDELKKQLLGKGTIGFKDGDLFVQNTERVHERVEDVIKAWRGARYIQRAIESRSADERIHQRIEKMILE